MTIFKTNQSRIVNLLKNNKGDSNITMIIWISIAFVTGGIVMVCCYGVAGDALFPFLENTFSKWLSDPSTKNAKTGTVIYNNLSS